MVAAMGGRHTADITQGIFAAMAKPSDESSHPENAESSELLARFGANVRAARLKLGLTQAQLAEQSGLLQQYVSLVESGKQNVTLTTALSLAKVVRPDLSNLVRRARSPARDKRA
jgi:DNA-binding XRE family transcriptional regulator